jgi:GntR family transcriptional regulator
VPPRDKFSTEPLYLQVRNLVAQRIASGIWAPGAMLPNETDLARELGVSPGTVRKALDSLESDRLVLRRQGRGTSVVDQATGDVGARFSNIRTGGGSGSSATWSC